MQKSKPKKKKEFPITLNEDELLARAEKVGKYLYSTSFESDNEETVKSRLCPKCNDVCAKNIKAKRSFGNIIVSFTCANCGTRRECSVTDVCAQYGYCGEDIVSDERTVVMERYWTGRKERK